jgi:hypothetical protein
VIIGKVCTSCDNACTGKLLDDIDRGLLALNRINVTAEDVSVWKMLTFLESESRSLSNETNALEGVKMFIDDFPTFRNLGSIMLSRARELESTCQDSYLQSVGAQEESTRLLGLIHLITNDIRGIILMLHDYVSGTNYNIINPNVALDEIEDVVDALEAVDLREAKGEAKFELEKAMETYQKVLSHINNVSDVSQKNVTEFRDRLDDLKQYISQAYKDQAQVGVPPPRLVINLLLDQFSNSHTHFRRIVW